MTRRSRICPTCQTTGIPIIHGMPPGYVMEAEEQGLLYIAGCEPGEPNLNWWCPNCEVEFAGPDAGRAIRDVLRPFKESMSAD